ncbi:hypothetical protein RvY_06661-2 [Ramazzottius varieornatus]|nr:hypothetical protein RvY_06661-2 [Ramazzottius varieornatus]
MSNIQTLIAEEFQVVNILREIIKAERTKLDFIQEYVDEFSRVYGEHSGDVTINSEVIASHPLNAFRLVKHLSVDWDTVRRLMTTNLAIGGVQEIERLRSLSQGLLNEEDLKGAVEAIVRLQYTYDIDEEQVASGTLTGSTVTALELSSLECYLLGLHQAQLGFHDYAVRWLSLAWKLFDQEQRLDIQKSSPIGKVEILDWLQHSTFQRGNISYALELSQQIKKINPAFAHVDENIAYYQKLLNDTPQEIWAKMEDENGKISGEKSSGTYEALCRGEGKLDINVEKQLHCYTETYSKPWLLLQPVKIEMAYLNPDIFVVHDVLFPSQMEQVKSVAKRKLQRAMVVKPGTTENQAARIRISKNAFLNEDVHPVIAAVNNRIGLVTNLDMRIAEELQVANYGIGGHYDAHFDHFRTLYEINHKHIDGEWGDRMATFLLYMSDVEAGGATVFPRINLTLYPAKGSAAFWFNLHKDGLGDERTLHAGCPVLVGSKWISNKWIREKWQDVTRPCGLQPDSPEWDNGWP